MPWQTEQAAHRVQAAERGLGAARFSPAARQGASAQCPAQGLCIHLRLPWLMTLGTSCVAEFCFVITGD